MQDPISSVIGTRAGALRFPKEAAKEAQYPRFVEPGTGVVSHVIFTENGILDSIPSNKWIYQNKPPSKLFGLPQVAPGVTRKRVGPFSTSNYFTQGTAGTSLLSIDGPFVGAIAFTPTTVDNAVLVDNYWGFFNEGWYIQLTGSGNGVALNGDGSTGPISLGEVRPNQLNIVVFGIENSGGVTTGWIKLNNNTAVSGAITYNVAANAIGAFGCFGATGTPSLPLLGAIDEFIIDDTTVPTALVLDAIYERAATISHGEALFEDTANTQLHLIGSDFNGTSWVAPEATLTTVGTVPSTTYTVEAKMKPRYGINPGGTKETLLANTGFYYVTGTPHFMDFDGVSDWWGVFIWIPSAGGLSTTCNLLSSGASSQNPGWQLVHEDPDSGGALPLSTVFIGSAGLPGQVVSEACIADMVNVVCFGKSSTQLFLKVNDNPMVTATGTITTEVVERRGQIGVHGDHLIGNPDTILEVYFAHDTVTETKFEAVYERVLAGL